LLRHKRELGYEYLSDEYLSEVRSDSGIWIGEKVSGEKGQSERVASSGLGIDINGSVSDGDRNGDSDGNGDRSSSSSTPGPRHDRLRESPVTPLPRTLDDSPTLRLNPHTVAPSVPVSAPRIPCIAQFHAFSPAMPPRLSPGTYRMQTWDESLGKYACAWTLKGFEDEASMQAVVERIDAAEQTRRREVIEGHERIIFAAAERSVREREGREGIGQGTGRGGGEAGFVKLSSVAVRQAVVDLLVQQGGEGWRAELEAKIGVAEEEDGQRTIRAGLRRCVDGVKGHLRKFFGRA
jgi:hypothetical protein